MLRRDFIMVQIEELAKVIAQIIDLRNTNAARKIPELIQTVYDSLGIDNGFLMATPPEDICSFLDKDDKGGILRAEIAVKALIEGSYLQEPARQHSTLARAKEILEYIQSHDNTFSLERVSLLNTINRLLSLK